MTRSGKCVLWGGYSHGNTGDELTLAIALRDMERRFGAKVSILSWNPEYTRALFPGRTVLRYEPIPSSHPSLRLRIKRRLKLGSTSTETTAETPPWVNDVRDAELLYLVGGGYLTDIFDLGAYLAPVRVATESGVRIESAPLGVGPLLRTGSLQEIASALRGAHLKVRDPQSMAVCAAAGVSAEIAKDDGFRAREVAALSSAERGGRAVIGVCFFQQFGAVDEAPAVWWTSLLEHLANRGYAFEGFCFHTTLSTDFTQTSRLLGAPGLPASRTVLPCWDFRKSIEQLSRYSAIVTARFHAAVIANLLEMPALAVCDGQYYTAKMEAACASSQRMASVDVRRMSPSDAAATLQRLIAG